MLKYPIFLQDNENSCGAYCIKMLLSFYKRDDEIKNIKKRCRLTKEGITVYGLIQVLKEYHLEAKAYQCEFKHLFEEVNCPVIIHLKQDDLYHYVVLYNWQSAASACLVFFSPNFVPRYKSTALIANKQIFEIAPTNAPSIILTLINRQATHVAVNGIA